MKAEEIKRIERYAEALGEITKREWDILKVAMDREFNNKVCEFEKSCTYTDPDKVMKIIQLQFG